jgi:hypothetical protein
MCLVTVEGSNVGQVQKELRKAEEDLRKRLPLGQKLPERVLMEFFRRKARFVFIQSLA